MAVVSGDITEITCKHDELGDFTFYPVAGEDNTLQDGGFQNEQNTDAVDGSGRSLNKKMRKKWSFSGPVAWKMHDPDRDEFADIKALEEHPDEGEWTFEHVSGAIWSATGTPAGGQEGNVGTGRFELQVEGGGRIEKIAP